MLGGSGIVWGVVWELLVWSIVVLVVTCPVKWVVLVAAGTFMGVVACVSLGAFDVGGVKEDTEAKGNCVCIGLLTGVSVVKSCWVEGAKGVGSLWGAKKIPSHGLIRQHQVLSWCPKWAAVWASVGGSAGWFPVLSEVSVISLPIISHAFKIDDMLPVC